MSIVTIMKIPNLVWFMQRMCVFGVRRGGFVNIRRRSSMQFQFKRFNYCHKTVSLSSAFNSVGQHSPRYQFTVTHTCIYNL